jgi:peroxiredoxin Q/BCP
LRSFQQRLPEFEARGVRVVAISSDPADVLKRHRERNGFTFPLLSDPKAEVIRRYDLLHEHAGPGHADIARPGEFLIDRTGTVRWVNLTESITTRARPDQVLTTLDAPQH